MLDPWPHAGDAPPARLPHSPPPGLEGLATATAACVPPAPQVRSRCASPESPSPGASFLLPSEVRPSALGGRWALPFCQVHPGVQAQSSSFPGPAQPPGGGSSLCAFFPLPQRTHPARGGGGGPTHYKAPVLPSPPTRYSPPGTGGDSPAGEWGLGRETYTHPAHPLLVQGAVLFPSSLPVTLFLLRSRRFQDVSFYSDFIPLSCWPGLKNNIQTTESNRGVGGGSTLSNKREPHYGVPSQHAWRTAQRQSILL